MTSVWWSCLIFAPAAACGCPTVAGRRSSTGLRTCRDSRLAGGRAYWEQTGSSLSTLEGELASSSVHDRPLRGLDYQDVPVDAPLDRLQPPVGDGTHVYFWSGSQGDDGPIARLDGVKRHRVSDKIPVPSLLAAGGGRFAYATRNYDGSSSPAWSPNGSVIAYARLDPRSPCYPCRPGNAELWLVKADRTNQHRIAAHGSDPDWSPDGTELAYSGPGNTVVIANADGSDPHVVTTGSDPAWAPNGRELAIVDQGGIWTVGTDGQDRRLIVSDGAQPDWSPDGSRLVFAAGKDQSEVVVARADGTGEHTLVDAGTDPEPAWSPDGSEIAFNTGPFNCGMQQSEDGSTICEVHPDGTGAHALYNLDFYWQNAWDPAWSPSSGRLVFVWEDRSNGDGEPHLAFSPSELLTRTPDQMTIVVSTAGGRVVDRVESGGEMLALAVSSKVTAAVVHEPTGKWAIEIYQPQPRAVPLTAAPTGQLAAEGTTLVFQLGSRIEALDAVAGSMHPVATTSGAVMGLSIAGRRVAWAERAAGGARIRAVELP